MKNLNLTIVFCLFAYYLMAQTMNPSFEVWVTDSNTINVNGSINLGPLSGSYEIDDPKFYYERPDGWSTVNQLSGSESMKYAGTQNSNVLLVVESSDAQHLNSSISIETRSVDIEAEVTISGQTNPQSFTNQSPGLAVCGEFNIDLELFAEGLLLGGNLNSLNPFDIPGTGQPIDFAPNSLKGFYKYTGVNGDSALIFTGVIKNREIIAYAIKRLPDAANWTAFNIEYNYLACETPDTIITAIISSNLEVEFSNGEFTIDSDYTGENGSLLLVDNLTMDTFDFDNFPPSAVNDNFTVVSNQATELDVTANDFSCGEGELVPIIFEEPLQGTVSVSGNNNVEYTSDAEFTGNDSFTYYVCNIGGCDTAYVLVQVSPIPECEAVDVTRTMESNTVDVFNATANDLNCGAIPELVNQPQNGVASVLADGQISYSPNTNYIGSDTFEYSICSELNPTQCDTATINYTVILSLNDLSSNLFSIYPNPAQSVLNIKYEGTDAKIYVYDLQGKILIHEAFNYQLQLNTSSLNNGLYIVKLETNKGFTHEKIQISK